MNKELIKEEYERAKIHYKAMLALMLSEDIDIDGEDITPEPEPVPTPAPQPEPTPEPVPVSTEPEVVYGGPSDYTLKPGERAKFSVYVNNVSSSRDYTVSTIGDPAFMNCEEVGYKTKTGYRLDFDITAKNYGRGTIKTYLTKNQNKCVTITINIKQ